MNGRHRSRGPLAIALTVALSLGAGAARGHGGEDHSHDDKPAAGRTGGGQPAAIVGDASAPQRLPDGSVFVPKPAQHQLGLRHRVVELGEHPATIEFSGRVIADPNASGRVQGTQAGRIEAGAGGLPLIGQRVARGQVLARLQPSTSAIERGNQ